MCKYLLGKMRKHVHTNKYMEMQTGLLSNTTGGEDTGKKEEKAVINVKTLYGWRCSFPN